MHFSSNRLTANKHVLRIGGLSIARCVMSRLAGEAIRIRNQAVLAEGKPQITPHKSHWVCG